jgi:hypothetical protein
MARSMNLRRAVATATALLGLLVVGTGGSAYAGVLARASATKSVASGTWAVVPTLSAAPAAPAAAPLALSFAGTTRVLFEAVNTGTLAVTEASYNVVVGTLVLQTPTIVLDACVGGTWTSVTACSGTVTRIGTSWTSSAADNAKLSASPAVPAAAGSRLHIRATLSGVLLGTPTVTVNISVASGPTRQIRAPLVTNG